MNEKNHTLKLSHINKTGKYLIKKVENTNPKFVGMGIVEGNLIEILRITKHLIHFRICNTEMFSRKHDIIMELEHA